MAKAMPYLAIAFKTRNEKLTALPPTVSQQNAVWLTEKQLPRLDQQRRRVKMIPLTRVIKRELPFVAGHVLLRTLRQ